MEESRSRTQEMLAAALEIEERGKEFYDRARSSCRDRGCREIFAALMKEEVLHRERILHIYRALKESGVWTEENPVFPTSPPEVNAVFKRLEKKAALVIGEDDMKAVETGLALEQESIRFYQEHRDQAEGSSVAAFLDRMITEEKGHLRSLQDLRYYLTDPEGWFLEKERAGLDGT